jgi:CRISPR-associated protein Cmr6
METGTLIVFKTKKGFAAKIAYEKPDGKRGELPVPSFQPKDDVLNDTACTFKREGGKLLQLLAHDGTELVSEVRSIPQTTISHQSSTNLGRQQQGNRIADGFSPQDTFLPKDTAETLRLHAPDNFALKLNKAARAEKEKGKFLFFKRERKGDNYQIQADYGDIDFKALANKALVNAEHFLSKRSIQSIDLDTNWRLIQGLGIESVYETSITLHHIYGIPYIPASTIKGVVRSWIISEVYGKPEKAGEEKDFPLVNGEFRALTQSEDFCKLFGCPSEVKPVKFRSGKPVFKKDKRGKETSSYEEDKSHPCASKNPDSKGVALQGQIVFFDAFPLNQPTIEFDVMNPHYAPYYSDKTAKTAPADYHNPIPVHFLTVANTRFRFIIGALDSSSLNITIEGKTIFDWLTEALTSHGIGAKTAVGYGYFNPQ